jgi:hypothetical protein
VRALTNERQANPLRAPPRVRVGAFDHHEHDATRTANVRLTNTSHVAEAGAGSGGDCCPRQHHDAHQRFLPSVDLDSKQPFGGPEAVLAYLSRYTHRVAIANSRLIALDKQGVTFKWKDYRIETRDRYKCMTLTTDEFIRRFLIHVLPKGLHRIRHYGLFAKGACADNIARARELLAVAKHDGQPTAAAVNQSKPTCQCCGGRMIIIEVFERSCTPRHRPTAPTNRIRIDTL